MKLIEALAILQKRNPADPVFPVELICGFTAQPLLTLLAAHLQSRLPGRFVEPREGRFGDLTGNLERYLQRGSGAAALVIEWADLDSRLGWRRHGGWGRARVADICGVVERQLAILQDRLTKSSGPGPIAVALPTLPPAPVEPVPGWQYGALASRLDSMAASLAADLSPLPHIRVVSPDRLASISPLHLRPDFKSLQIGGFPYQVAHAAALADLLAQSLQPPPVRKGVITDLDNTLWDGILGEDGVEGVSWDLEHHSAQYGAYQQMLQSLADSGILIGIASKNDPALVQSALARPDLLLRPASVFPVEAHWSPKSHSVERILQTWNIGAADVVFIDDSSLELAEVKTAIPAIDCRRFDKDPDRVAALLAELADLCGKPFDSAEDALRLSSLRTGAEFKRTGAGTESLEQVLAGAEGVLTILPVTPPPDPRALELVNKTNQFNLNGFRFAETEWAESLKCPDRLVWLASYADRFGPLGKIAVAAGRLASPDELELDTWVLSCRAFARRIEYAMLDALFQRTGVRRIRFRFVPTERNGPLQEFLEQLLGSIPAGFVTLDTAAFEARKLPWFLRVKMDM